jgi:hypothetical protein
MISIHGLGPRQESTNLSWKSQENHWVALAHQFHASSVDIFSIHDYFKVETVVGGKTDGAEKIRKTKKSKDQL